jgi:hypothetical protein
MTNAAAFKPYHRRLRIYAVEPRFAGRPANHFKNELLLKIPWEDDLQPGPTGEYVEIIDYDPASGCFYAPTDLNAPFLLAQDGFPPAEGLPGFHHQTVYGLTMTLVREFERALGRFVLWAPHSDDQVQFVQRLRIYPHALREPTAYYNPEKIALLLGYFPLEPAASTADRVQRIAFTCLSPAILLHETALAVLDGVGWGDEAAWEAADGKALLDGVAELCAICLQFSLPGFLRSQIDFTSNPEKNAAMLKELAARLGEPLVPGKSLRTMIGGVASPSLPVSAWSFEWQERAACLVASVFDAFLTIHRRRCAHLWQIAGVTGNPDTSLPLNDNLLEAIAAEAAKSAQHLLRMSIRAIDYCPPVDITLEDYLRAIVTADFDISPEDAWGYRDALVHGFEKFGIVPREAASMAPLDLRLPPAGLEILFDNRLLLGLPPTATRDLEFQQEQQRRASLHSFFQQARPITGLEAGLVTAPDAVQTINRDSNNMPRFTVDSARLAQRSAPNGTLRSDWIVSLSQTRHGYFDSDLQEKQDREAPAASGLPPDFALRGGCTLLVDAATGKVRFCIVKDILSEERLVRAREFHARKRPSESAPAETAENRGEGG